MPLTTDSLTNQSHRVGERPESTWDFAAGLERVDNFFTDVRSSTLRQMMLGAARDAELPVFDFGMHWEVRRHSRHFR